MMNDEMMNECLRCLHIVESASAAAVASASAAAISAATSTASVDAAAAAAAAAAASASDAAASASDAAASASDAAASASSISSILECEDVDDAIDAAMTTLCETPESDIEKFHIAAAHFVDTYSSASSSDERITKPVRIVKGRMGRKGK
jgi:hypothetical protein